MQLDFHQKIQEDEYAFPYHHLVNFSPFASGKTLFWGLEYYSYLSCVLDKLGGFDWDSLLEVGCGDGKFIAEATSRFPDRQITGIDYSERAILFAKAFNFNNGAELVCGDVAGVERTFDVLAVIETLEHIPDSRLSEFVQTLSQRLNPEGTLVVTVPTINAPLQDKHYRHYDIALLERHLAGFTLVSAQYVMKTGWIRRALFSLATKGSGMLGVQRLTYVLARRNLFTASARTGRHLVATFSRQ